MNKTYKDRQREIAVQLIQAGFFEGDAGNGRFFGIERPFVLSDRLKNLYPDIRTDVLRYFKQNGATWWGGYFPTGHTLSSQIACLNHLFPIRQDREAVLALLNTVSDDFVDVFPIQEHMSGYIQFEAVGGDVNFLNEDFNTRGSNCTSVDALIYALDKTGKRFLIPIEWKYTEAYGNDDKSSGSKGKTRKCRYTKLIENSSFLNDNTLSCCWYEPFYQLMRQTLWAEQVIKHKVVGFEADDYLHIHVVPNKNAELLHKEYRCSGKNMEDTWKSCLKQPDKYKLIPPEQLWRGQNRDTNIYKYLQYRYWED